MKEKFSALYAKDATKKVISSLISILAGLLVGGIVVLAVGLFNSKISPSGIWDGIRLIFAGILSTGRDAAGALTWGFNAQNIGNMLFRATPKLGLDKLFSGSQVNAGILVAIVLAIVVYIVMEKTTFGYELKACGSNRHAARYAGIADRRNIVLSMAIAGALAGAGAALYWLSGNTEFYWNTYQSLPGVGFNGIPVALLAVNNPIAVIFTGIFMAMLDIVGMQLTNLTAYNEYITNVIISVIVYLSAFSLVIRMWLTGRRKRRPAPENPPAAASAEAAAPPDTPPAQVEKGGDEA